MASTENWSAVLSFSQAAEPYADKVGNIDLPALVAAYAPTLFRVAYSILRSRTEAEDVVQDAFVRVLEHRQSLSSVRDLRLWLVRIAWNLALDRKRRLRPDQLDEYFARGLAGIGTSADVALTDAIEELSIAEISMVVGRSESAVRALLSRARQRLRERLAAGKEKRWSIVKK